MRHFILIAAALLYGQAFAGTDCKPPSQTPVTISLVAQHGVTTMRSSDKFVGTSAPQAFTSPNFTFSIVAVASCNEGLEINLRRWNQATVVNGTAGTDHHITITAKPVR